MTYQILKLAEVRWQSDINFKLDKKMKPIILAILMCLIASVADAATADSRLLEIPSRILSFRVKSLDHGGYDSTHDMLVKKWNYVNFLTGLINDVNIDVTSGDALSAEQIEAIAAFAQLTVILLDGYIPSSTRGSSGFESREVDTRIQLLEQTIRDLIPAIGKCLSLYQQTEKDWDSIKVETWQREYAAATRFEPGRGWFSPTLPAPPDMLVSTRRFPETTGPQFVF